MCSTQVAVYVLNLNIFPSATTTAQCVRLWIRCTRDYVNVVSLTRQVLSLGLRRCSFLQSLRYHVTSLTCCRARCRVPQVLRPTLCLWSCWPSAGAAVSPSHPRDRDKRRDDSHQGSQGYQSSKYHVE